MAKKIEHTTEILLVVLAIGILMRSPITTLPLVLTQLAHHLAVSTGSLGILTTLPLVMFLLFSNFAAVPLAKLGIKPAMTIALVLLLAGSALRLVVTLPTMLLGTIFIGISIAHLNVFMPAFIKAYFPLKIALYTTLYSFSMNLGSAGFNLVTAPVVTHWGWQAILVILTVVPLLVVIFWGLMSRHLPEKMKTTATTPTQRAPHRSIWANPHAWLFLITFGCQSLLNYTMAAWFPVLMGYHHLSAGHIGIIMAVYSLVGIPVYILTPHLLTALGPAGVKTLIAIPGSCGIIAGLMLFFQNTASFGFWLTENILVGIAISFFFIYTTTMFGLKTADPLTTARLSGMAQAGGYFMAALGPSLYGWAFRVNPTGLPQNLVYVGLIVVAILGALGIQRLNKVA
ncbi:MFS transporter [Levilactobacillus zymae]|uniref:MFS transporter n=1 Tax=Levilactobacillus zymae TaxID=267363 RepID=UPI0028B88C3B|nr:MFS transporter [Levilactobacillus zymae]MDT6981581.1 MFS transporter [Levilactobacillus zymae]